MSFFSPFVLVLAVRARTLKKKKNKSVDRLGFSGMDHARYVKEGLNGVVAFTVIG